MILALIAGISLAQKPAAPVAHAFQEIGFERDLHQGQDLTLLGFDPIGTVGFSRPAAWKLTEDPVLHLALDHSAMLDTDRSTLTIKLNGVTLHTVGLDANNAIDGELVVALPRRILRDHNRLQFEASQHVLTACEDPYDPALWTRILSSSSIRFYRDVKPHTASLSDFPDLLLDPSGHGPMHLTLAGQGPLDPTTLNALGRIGLSLGRHAGYRGVVLEPAVDTVIHAKTHTLVIGTPANNALVRSLVDTSALEPGQGLLAVVNHPVLSEAAVLVVTGADPLGLNKAVNALAGADMQELLSGPIVVLDESQAQSMPERDQVPRPAPPSLTFSLADLGIADQTVRGTYANAVTIALSLEADSQFYPDSASLRLDYAYGAQLDPEQSSLEVLLNGVTLRSVALDKAGGDPDAHLDLTLRHSLMSPSSEVTVLFHLVSADSRTCILQRNRQLWATVFETSRFEIDRIHIAELPDLSLLRHGLWPLGPALDRDGVAILLPDNPSWDNASAAFLAAVALGRVSSGTTPELTVVAGSPDAMGAVRGRHLLVLADGSDHAPLRVMGLIGSLQVKGGQIRQLTGSDGAVQMAFEVMRTAATLEQVLYQTEPVRTALILQADGPHALLALTATLGEPHSLQQLEGSAAFLEPNGAIATLASAERVVVGQQSIWARMQLVLSSTGLPLALILAFVGTLMTIVVSRWAVGRQGQI
jgi:hypothetical protein